MATVAILRNVAGLTFDATFNEAHQSELTVTDNPVDIGRKVSDNAFMEPLTLQITAGVSDTPLHVQPSDPFGGSGARTKRAFDMLTKLQSDAEPFDVQTGLKLYTNMVCKTLKASQDKDTDGALIFTAEFREVIIVYTRVITYPPRAAGATTRQASAKAQAGEQQGTQVTAPAKSSSVLKQLKNAIGG